MGATSPTEKAYFGHKGYERHAIKSVVLDRAGRVVECPTTDPKVVGNVVWALHIDEHLLYVGDVIVSG